MISNLSNLIVSRGGAFTHGAFVLPPEEEKFCWGWNWTGHAFNLILLARSSSRWGESPDTRTAERERSARGGNCEWIIKPSVGDSANYPLRKPTRESMISSTSFFGQIAFPEFRRKEKKRNRKENKSKSRAVFMPHCLIFLHDWLI